MPIDSTTAPAASKAADSPLANHDRTITGVVPSTPIPRGRTAQDRKWPVFVADFGPNPRGGALENYALALCADCPRSLQKLQVNQIVPSREDH